MSSVHNMLQASSPYELDLSYYLYAISNAYGKVIAVRRLVLKLLPALSTQTQTCQNTLVSTESSFYSPFLTYVHAVQWTSNGNLWRSIPSLSIKAIFSAYRNGV